MGSVVDEKEPQGEVLRAFAVLDALEVFAVAPCVEQAEPQCVFGAVGKEVPFALFGIAGIFVHRREILEV